MDTSILGKIAVDEGLFQEDINKILQFKFSDVYSDYVIGEWKACILWNHTGSADDSLLKEYEGKVQPTELGRQLDYLNTIIQDVFYTKYIKWVRVFLMRKGLLLPHTDYLELKKGFVRVHIPLQTDITCLHSSQDMVFHMGKGEVWFLDAAKPHSACNFSDIARLSLCIDFDPSMTYNEIFKDKQQYAPDLECQIIKRPPMDVEYMRGIQGLGYLIEEDNFDDIVSLLAKVHFVRDANAGAMFDWLIDITQRSGNKHLLEKALAMKSFCIEKRSLGEVL